MAVRIAIASGKGGRGKSTVATNLYRTINRDLACRAIGLESTNRRIPDSIEIKVPQAATEEY